MRAVILAGGDLKVTPELKAISQTAELTIAADGGLRHALSLDLKPHIIVGDFDSVSEKDLASFANVPRQKHPTDKNKLDLELALDYALAEGAAYLNLLGTLGGRFDQSLAAVFIAAKHAREAKVSLHTGFEDVFLLSDPVTKTLQVELGQSFSLLSLCESSVLSVRGARYELSHHSLPFGVGLGVSNEVISPPLKVSVHRGLSALILEHERR